MATFDESIVSVSGRLGHERDFTFYKNNGDIANRIRTELGSTVKEMRIDKDGDIEIDSTDVGDIILTPDAVIAAAWLTNLKTVSTRSEIEKFANTIEALAKSKGSFTTEYHNVRLFFRFRPENALALLRDRGFESGLRLILGEKAPYDATSLKFSSLCRRDGFLDSIELEASSKDVQLRYSRTGADFDSYPAFVEAANLAELFEELKPFAESLMAMERGLGRGLLSEMK